jgi:hypothetical protein
MFFSEAHKLIFGMINRDVNKNISSFHEMNFKNLERELMNTEIIPFGITKLRPTIQLHPMGDYVQQLSLVSIISNHLASSIVGKIPNYFSLRSLKIFKLTEEMKRIRENNKHNWLLTIVESQIRYKLPKKILTKFFGDKYGTSRAIRPLLIIPDLDEKDRKIVSDWEESNFIYLREGKMNYYFISQKEYINDYLDIQEEKESSPE